MPYRLPSTALVLAACAAAGLPAPATAQDSTPLPDLSQIPGLSQLQDGASGGATTGDEGLPTNPDDLSSLLGGTPVEPGAAPTTPDTQAPAPATGTDAQATTPVPPSYLAPGPGAAQQPIRAVAQLTEPEVPLEPLRLGALVASIVAILLIAIAAILRALGVRTPVVDPIPVPAGHGPVARAGERLRGTADDMRDFLRRSR